LIIGEKLFAIHINVVPIYIRECNFFTLYEKFIAGILEPAFIKRNSASHAEELVYSTNGWGWMILMINWVANTMVRIISLLHVILLIFSGRCSKWERGIHLNT